MTLAYPATAFAPAHGAWRRHLVALGLVAIAIGVLFRRDLVAMAGLWWSSTTFGHCVFVPPILAWLVWQRRAALATLSPVGWWPGLIVVAAAGIGWLVGEAAPVAALRQFAVVAMLEGAVVTLLGPRIARGLAFPLGWAFFLVPFGLWLEPPLQAVTVRLTLPLLHLAGLPAVSDGVVIHAGRYYFEVAEACSGAKFVIAMAAVGTLVANVCFLSWRRRIGFIALALVVPVAANGVRAFATMWAANLTDVATATGFDHIVYAWVWFGLVMAAVLALGWRWFDRPADAPMIDVTRLALPPAHRLALLPAAAAIVVLAAMFPAWDGLTAGRTPSLPTQLVLPEVSGWHRVPLSTVAAWRPAWPDADHHLIGRYADRRGNRVDLAVAVFARQREGAKLLAFGTGAVGAAGPWLRVDDAPPIAGGTVLLLRAPGPHDRLVATWYVVGGRLLTDPAAVKLATAAARLLGGDQRAAALHLSAEVTDRHDARAAIAAFAAALGPPDRMIDRMIAPRGAGSRQP